MCHDHIHPHHPEADRFHTHSQSTQSRRDILRLAALGIAGLCVGGCGRQARPQPLSAAQLNQPLATAEPAVRDAFPGFDAFLEQIRILTDGTYLRIESTGMPTHAMMVGIRSWQQQVPLPQPYRGANAWSIPLKPKLADAPISAKNNLYRGAIALAVNGVPIFNALNNRGDDAYLAGELDEWGGHAGRADDYHYHTAPLHLQSLVGADKPIAYALDGYPLYGLNESDGSAATGLDEFNGHFDKAGNYHYHASNSYPYINGGLRGVVAVPDDQIEPQPRTIPIRPSLEPLRGAVITGFQTLGKNSYSLEYTLDDDKNRGKNFVNYQFEAGSYTFEFIDSAGNTRTETYQGTNL